MSDYLHVPNWGEFQHADTTKRGKAPVWIKTYTRLLSDDDYLSLSGPQRATLHGIWLEHARSGGKVPRNTAKLSRRLGLHVTKKTLDALKASGFIDFRQDNVTTASSLEEKRGERDVTTDRSLEALDVARARGSDIGAVEGGVVEPASTGLGASGVLVRPGSVLAEVEALAARESGRVVPIGDAPSRRVELLDGFMAVVVEAAAESDAKEA